MIEFNRVQIDNSLRMVDEFHGLRTQLALLDHMYFDNQIGEQTYAVQ